MQVYRYLDIGSGKLTRGERQRVPHHCIDIVDPDEDFTVGDFIVEAESAVSKVINDGKLPVFTGGTGFYIDSFFNGLSEVPDIDENLRDEVEKELKESGPESLYRELKQVDPAFAQKVHVNDHQRIIRGISVYRSEERPLSSFFEGRRGHGSSDTLYLALWVENDILKERIDNRVTSMLALGFLEEVLSLREKGYGPNLKAMQSIGYHELNRYIDGELTYDEAVEIIKIETRRYAKRQMTWFRRNKKIEWFHYRELDRVKDRVNIWLEHKNKEEK